MKHTRTNTCTIDALLPCRSLSSVQSYELFFPLHYNICYDSEVIFLLQSGWGSKEEENVSALANLVVECTRIRHVSL